MEVGKLEALWGKRPRFPGYVLFLSRNKTSLGAWFSLGQDPLAADKEGVQVPRQGVRTNGEVYPDQYAGARVVVNLANIELNGDDPRAVMRHELTHAIAARATKYSLDMGALRGHVNTVLAEVTVQANRSAQGGKGGAASGTVPFLLWFASLPFADDPLTVADVKTWLTRQVQAGKKATVNIAGYRYEVDASKEGAASFDMQG